MKLGRSWTLHPTLQQHPFGDANWPGSVPSRPSWCSISRSSRTPPGGTCPLVASTRCPARSPGLAPSGPPCACCSSSSTQSWDSCPGANPGCGTGPNTLLTKARKTVKPVRPMAPPSRSKGLSSRRHPLRVLARRTPTA